MYYAAAPVAGDEGWGHIYSDPHEIQQLQEDGETKAPLVFYNQIGTLRDI